MLVLFDLYGIVDFIVDFGLLYIVLLTFELIDIVHFDLWGIICCLYCWLQPIWFVEFDLYDVVDFDLYGIVDFDLKGVIVFDLHSIVDFGPYSVGFLYGFVDFDLFGIMDLTYMVLMNWP